MKVCINAFLVVVVFINNIYAQSLLKPGDNAIEKKWLKTTTYEMACFAVNGNEMIEVSSLVINVAVNDKTVSVYTAALMYMNNEQWFDTSIADAVTLKPLYRSSFNSARNYSIQYGKEITGYYFDAKTKKKSPVKDAAREQFFDSYMYPYLLTSLPLASGYKADLPVYDYKPLSSSNIKTTRIEEVKNSMYISSMTGEHKAWQVSVFEEATNEKYDYFIDKESRKLWKIEIRGPGGRHFILLNKEMDYNPFTSTFNKEETLKLIQSGSATISGQAYARDNENEGLLKGIAVFNINKKQYAKPGTSILLIPYTPYFKEWISLNEKLRKKGRSIPLAKEAAECIKTTTVYDQDGHFEFTNLMPGDYLLYTEFGYVHTRVGSQVVGYTDTYINGIFQGSTAQRAGYRQATNASATIKKIITVKKEGEKVNVKLKKTL